MRVLITGGGGGRRSCGHRGGRGREAGCSEPGLGARPGHWGGGRGAVATHPWRAGRRDRHLLAQGLVRRLSGDKPRRWGAYDRGAQLLREGVHREPLRGPTLPGPRGAMWRRLMGKTDAEGASTGQELPAELILAYLAFGRRVSRT